MQLLYSSVLLAALAWLASSAPTSEAAKARSYAAEARVPTAQLAYGTYHGKHNSHFDQDLFLGIPYAQPPIGSLRFAPPQALTTSFEAPRNVTEYGPLCIGYGGDTTALGDYVSEDCLTINIVRPAGVAKGDDLPVAVWVHGGAYTQGGSMDPRYNLSRIVEQSVAQGTPMIAASINYRLSYWGFMFSHEMEAAGAGNLAFRDQRMALEWIRDHVGSFGGSSERVTVWGESAGARSLGMQLVAYEGDHQNLFQRAILESGSPVANFATSAQWQPWFDALVDKTGCADSSDRLQCLRQLPVQTLNDVFNSTMALSISAPTLSAVLDGDFMTNKGADLLRNGKFAKVPLLVGNNFDEGTQYGEKGINTTAQFLEYVKGTGASDALAEAIAEQYPDDPAKGIPATLDGRPSAYPWGLQWKRVAAYAGDMQQHSGRRLLAESYTSAGVPVYSYRFNVLVNGLTVEEGAKHFQEVAFVFDNTVGQGYDVNPFEGEPSSFVELADLMSRMWVSFVSSGNPNVRRNTTCLKWPRYQLDNPCNIVFDVNATHLTYLEPDNYRQEEIEFLIQNYYA